MNTGLLESINYQKQMLKFGRLHVHWKNEPCLHLSKWQAYDKFGIVNCSPSKDNFMPAT